MLSGVPSVPIVTLLRASSVTFHLQHLTEAEKNFLQEFSVDYLRHTSTHKTQHQSDALHANMQLLTKTDCDLTNITWTQKQIQDLMDLLKLNLDTFQEAEKITARTLIRSFGKTIGEASQNSVQLVLTQDAATAQKNYDIFWSDIAENQRDGHVLFYSMEEYLVAFAEKPITLVGSEEFTKWFKKNISNRKNKNNSKQQVAQERYTTFTQIARWLYIEKKSLEKAKAEYVALLLKEKETISGGDLDKIFQQFNAYIAFMKDKNQADPNITNFQALVESGPTNVIFIHSKAAAIPAAFIDQYRVDQNVDCFVAEHKKSTSTPLPEAELKREGESTILQRFAKAIENPELQTRAKTDSGLLSTKGKGYTEELGQKRKDKQATKVSWFKEYKACKHLYVALKQNNLDGEVLLSLEKICTFMLPSFDREVTEYINQCQAGNGLILKKIASHPPCHFLREIFADPCLMHQLLEVCNRSEVGGSDPFKEKINTLLMEGLFYLLENEPSSLASLDLCYFLVKQNMSKGINVNFGNIFLRASSANALSNLVTQMNDKVKGNHAEEESFNTVKQEIASEITKLIKRCLSTIVIAPIESANGTAAAIGLMKNLLDNEVESIKNFIGENYYTKYEAIFTAEDNHARRDLLLCFLREEKERQGKEQEEKSRGVIKNTTANRYQVFSAPKPAMAYDMNSVTTYLEMGKNVTTNDQRIAFFKQLYDMMQYHSASVINRMQTHAQEQLISDNITIFLNKCSGIDSIDKEQLAEIEGKFAPNLNSGHNKGLGQSR